MKLTDQETLQAVTDAFGALALALAKQVDEKKLIADLQAFADEAAQHDKMPSAGLLDEIVKTLQARSASNAH